MPDAPAVEAAASEYLRRGRSIVPVVPRGKQPLVPWRDYQQKRATPEQARTWYRRWPDADVGVDLDVIKELLLCWNRVRARPYCCPVKVARIVWKRSDILAQFAKAAS